MDRNSELLFAKKLEEIKKLAQNQGNTVSSEKINETFKELNLNDEQLSLIYDYLKKAKIGIDEDVDLDSYLSEEEVNYLEIYMEDLKSLPEYSDGEKEAYFLSSMAGESSAQKKLIDIFLPQVVEISKLYSGQGVCIEDLIGEGNMALTLGVCSLASAENAKDAEGMLVKMIMDSMEDLITENLADAGQDQKITDSVNKVLDEARRLSEDLGKKVTPEELSENSGIPVETIIDVIKITGNKIEEIEYKEL